MPRWIGCARGLSKPGKGRAIRAVGQGKHAERAAGMGRQRRNRDLPVDDRKVCGGPGGQTFVTTSEAGKRTFFWEAYLSSSARYPAAQATTVR